MRRNTILIAALFSALALAGCAPSADEAPVIRIGLLPILDALPIHAADALGYFEEEGLTISIVPVSSGPERDQLMQSGQIDAMINELVSVMFFNQDEVNVVAVRFARTASVDTPLFQILAAPGSGMTSPTDLIGVEIAISEGTVIEYTTERMLESAGLLAEEIVTIAVPKIPDRLNLLLAGQIEAATLPEPAVTVAIQNGAAVVVNDTIIPDLSNSLITFDLHFVEAHPETVRAFLRAIERAVEAINTDPAAWDDLLMERGLLAPELVDLVNLPPYPSGAVPSEAQFADALLWAQSKGYIEEDLSYQSCVTGAYLP